ncbi:MAG TPA: WD40 repeat domain-containing serine/threonine protein kinase [Thermoanaerobaculia bacterium]|jgi:serine/threonine protein kinase/Tol biopolymer transport system component|nr:WD40 repeat domain-containing serine/threonine protein kinase [Thermoanaerobaculia bacterium]
MPIAPGTSLGRYEIVCSIGSGGMGEVYRATDATLHRDVALKILPAELIKDESRLLRFEQEARATAALHHPNIVTIHDFGTSDSIPYLVTELLEGESLADVLGRGPVPLRRSIAWSVQILRGIAAAHARGIVHRDLKPANIFILADGSVKILDFGLAKVAHALGNTRDAPTERISEAGMVFGTIGYMSPEQLRGETVDARSDIFSFGVLLYEMLTGRTPFVRDTTAETITAILIEEAPRLDTPPFPAVLASTLVRCLEKNREERFHSAHDLALHIEMIDVAASGPAAAIAIARQTQPEIAQVTFHRGNVSQARFAPDGSIIYGAIWNDRPLELFVSHRGIPDTRALGVNGSVHSVSRSGELALSLGRHSEIGFLSSGTLARLPLAGGVPRPIAKDVHEADWSPDGRQLAIARRSERGFQIEYPIGNRLYESPSWISDMRFSPDGREIAFLEHPFAGDNFGSVRVVDLHGHVESLTDDLYIAWGLAWNPVTGEIFYSGVPQHGQEGRNVSVYAVSRGHDPREIFATLGGAFIHDIAPDGTMLVAHQTPRRYIVGHIAGEETDRDLSWFDWGYPMRLSNDGNTLLFEEQGIANGGKFTFYLRDARGGPAVRLDEGRGRDLSSDGEHVLALSNDKPERVMLVPTGAGSMRDIPVRGVNHFQTVRFLPGDKELLIVGSSGDEEARIWRVGAEGGDAQPLSDAVGSWFFLAVSPDGRQVVTITANQTLFICSLDGATPARSVPGAEPGDLPIHWPHDNEILVCRRDNKKSDIYAIDLTTGARRFVRTMRPPDAAGVEGVFPILYASNSDSYVFGYKLLLTSLFTVSGLR